MQIKILLTFALVFFSGIGIKHCPPALVRKVAAGYNGTVLEDPKGTQRTPGGALISYGVKPLTPAQLDAVDAGLKRAIENAKASGYTEPRSQKLDFYEIETPPYECILSPIQKIPSFLIRADNYDGTKYDLYNQLGPEKDPAKIARGIVYENDAKGVIYAAELVMNEGTITSTIKTAKMYVCITGDLAGDTEAVNNGAEHILIANNDNDYFWQTVTHSMRGHPLLPKSPAAPSSAYQPQIQRSLTVEATR